MKGKDEGGHGMEEYSGRAAGLIESERDTNVTKSLVGVMKARDVHLALSAAGPVMASGNVSIQRGGCGPVMASGEVSIRQGGCGPMFVGGAVSIEQGGAQSVIAGGAVTIRDRSGVGLVLSPSVTVEEGGRVLMSTPQAAAFGAVLGLVIALLARRKKR
jgi:hypothetical protein